MNTHVYIFTYIYLHDLYYDKIILKRLEWFEVGIHGR